MKARLSKRIAVSLVLACTGVTLVGRAVAVNPDGALRKHARAVGWEIHDYRRARMNQRYYVPAMVAGAAGLGIGIGLGIAAAKNKP